MPSFKFKNSTTASSVPSNGSLETGEIAINIADSKAYVGDASLNTQKIIGTLASQESGSVSITGGNISVSSLSGTVTATSTTIGGGSVSNVTTYSGTSTTSLVSSAGARDLIKDQLSDRIAGVYTYSSAGTYTYTKSGPDVKTIHVICVGGGGGARAYSECGGGGGFTERVLDATSVTSVTVTVGGGGAGGVYFGFSNDGGTSSFGTYCSATGGYGSSRNAQHNGGHGGMGYGGNINAHGGMGGSHNNMDQYSPSNASGGVGGGTYFGGSMAGDRPDWSISQVAAPGTGGVAISPSHNGQGGRTGREGIVIVYEYK
jgi:hypothetical protein